MARARESRPLPQDEAAPGVPEWVVTYGDMMSLLLTFFIMLVSLGELKKEGHVRAMLDSIREAFGSSTGAAGVPGTSLQTDSILNKRNSRGSKSEGGLERSSRSSKGRGGPSKSVRRISHGSVVTMGGPALFPEFQAGLTDELRENLDVLADVVRDKHNMIVVRGHASPKPLPPDSGFQDKWDLSFQRALHAAEYLVEHGAISRDRILVSAAGDTEPVIVTQEQEKQQQNRRVDVFIIDSYIASPHALEGAR